MDTELMNGFVYVFKGKSYQYYGPSLKNLISSYGSQDDINPVICRSTFSLRFRVSGLAQYPLVKDR